MAPIDSLKARSAELTDLYHVLALMQWDQEVLIPSLGAADRAGQFETMSGVIHQREVDPALGELLKQAADQGERLGDQERGLVRVMRRSYDQNTKLPAEFVSRLARLSSEALQVWVRARQQSDFAIFAPFLEELVGMSRRKAEYLGYANEPYDALLDLHEEGLTTEAVEGIFGALRAPLKELLGRAAARGGQRLAVAPHMEITVQQAFADRILAAIGFDFERGRQDRSAHPFSTTLGHDDRRVTNRYRSDSVEFIFSALHEGGHALYEQGIDRTLARSQLDGGVSLGIHESQSRLWENIIGRSPEFWSHFYPWLQQAFPAQFGGLAVQDFVAGINRIEPGPIRVEADEVSYNLHVLIRFDIEKALFRGEIGVAELPEIWNRRYRDDLGVEVDTAANGVLQDIHWSHGSFGYFPTYTIGNLAAAQIWNSYQRFDPDPWQTVARGDLGRIRSWLGEQIYRHGRVHPPAELLMRVTGEALRPEYFLDYLRNKYDRH